MASQSIVTRKDYEDYLLLLYFGRSENHLESCQDRAYRDFSRTLHGLRSVETGSVLYLQARAALGQSLRCLASTNSVMQEQFDNWHEKTCEQLAEIYNQHSHRLFVGQAQKWINMTFKYVFTFGEERLPGFTHLYPYCHVPLDNIFIDYLRPYNSPKLSTRWSRLTHYDEYLQFQYWIRRHFAPLPLDTEFMMWLGRTPSFTQ